MQNFEINKNGSTQTYANDLEVALALLELDNPKTVTVNDTTVIRSGQAWLEHYAAQLPAIARVQTLTGDVLLDEQQSTLNVDKPLSNAARRGELDQVMVISKTRDKTAPVQIETASMWNQRQTAEAILRILNGMKATGERALASYRKRVNSDTFAENPLRVLRHTNDELEHLAMLSVVNKAIKGIEKNLEIENGLSAFIDTWAWCVATKAGYPERETTPIANFAKRMKLVYEARVSDIMTEKRENLL